MGEEHEAWTGTSAGCQPSPSKQHICPLPRGSDPRVRVQVRMSLKGPTSAEAFTFTQLFTINNISAVGELQTVRYLVEQNYHLIRYMHARAHPLLKSSYSQSLPA